MSPHSTNRSRLRAARRSGRKRGQWDQIILSGGKHKGDMTVEYKDMVRRTYDDLDAED